MGMFVSKSIGDPQVPNFSVCFEGREFFFEIHPEIEGKIRVQSGPGIKMFHIYGCFQN